MLNRWLLSVVIVTIAGSCQGQTRTSQATLKGDGLKIREVTIFKDGHAFVLEEGVVSTKSDQVVLDRVPTPVIGTFWPYVKTKDATLMGVVAGHRPVSRERRALTVQELVEANIGKKLR